jgi:hypothetical protein
MYNKVASSYIKNTSKLLVDQGTEQRYVEQNQGGHVPHRNLNVTEEEERCFWRRVCHIY